MSENRQDVRVEPAIPLPGYYELNCEILLENEGQKVLVQKIIRDDCLPGMAAAVLENSGGLV
jgi:hypothetical protein